MGAKFCKKNIGIRPTTAQNILYDAADVYFEIDETKLEYAATASGAVTASQTGTTVTASANFFNTVAGATIGDTIVFADGTTATINAITSDTVVEVDETQTVAAQAFEVRTPNFDLAGALAAGTAVGITNGDVNFKTNIEMREIEFNGKRAPYVGLTKLTAHGASVGFTFKEINVDNLMAALAVADREVLLNGTNKITGRLCLSKLDYIKNVALVIQHGERDHPMVIVLHNVLNTGGFDVNFGDNSEAEPSVEFTANYSLDEPARVPYDIYVSTESGFWATLNNYEVPLVVANAGTPVARTLDLQTFAGYTSGSYTLHLEDAPTGVFLVGDVVTIAGNLTTYTVNFDIAATAPNADGFGTLIIKGDNQRPIKHAVRFVVTQ